MKPYWIRILYIVTCLAIALTSVYYFAEITNTQTTLNQISYIGTIATFIGLIIAVCEILHSLKVSNSIQDESNKLLLSFKNIENASSISYCLSMIDDVMSYFEVADYEGALRNFQFFRRMFVKLAADLEINLVHSKQNGTDKSGLLGEIEELFSAGTHTTEDSPLSNAQKNKIRKSLLHIKHKIETKAFPKGN